MVSLMQNKGETDNRKATIMVSFDDFSTPSESRMFIFWLFHQFSTLRPYSRFSPWINLNCDVTSFVEPANLVNLILKLILV